MAKVRGKDLVLTINVGGVDTIIGCAKNCTLSTKKKMINTSDKDDGDWDSYLPDAGSWTMSSDGFYDPAKTLNVEEMHAYYIAGTALTVNMGVLGSSYPVAGQFYEGTVYIDSYDIASNMGDVVTFKVTFQGTSSLTLKNYSPGGSMS